MSGNSLGEPKNQVMLMRSEPSIDSVDRFYTKSHIAEMCWKRTCTMLRTLAEKDNADELFFFTEPSAGTGSFYNLLPEYRRVGMDIEPRCAGVTRRNFFDTKSPLRMRDNSKRVMIGNPPFGRRGKLAIDFVNHAATMADTIAFIVPVIFKKFFIHKQLSPDLKLILSAPLPRLSFYKENNKDHSVNTEFQIWTRLPTTQKDERLFHPPPIAHQDFTMWQYNNTEYAMKMFDNDFDFAVPCQGYQDYDRREIRADKCEKHKQWILFKAKDDIVYNRLYDMNYVLLSTKNVTSTPGFRKGDVVKEYAGKYDV